MDGRTRVFQFTHHSASGGIITYIYYNLLKYIVNICFDSADNDFLALQYTPLSSKIYVIYIMFSCSNLVVFKP
jgi:hypothetical protein